MPYHITGTVGLDVEFEWDREVRESGPGHVRCAVEVAGGFKVGVGLHHQESVDYDVHRQH